jgi:hypothetical protein
MMLTFSLKARRVVEIFTRCDEVAPGLGATNLLLLHLHQY